MFPEFIKDLFQEVEGQNSGQEVCIFTLSSCMWCKKAKSWLIDKGIKYRYVDVDKIDPSEKSKVLTYLRDTYKPDRISYPFVVWDDKFVVAYDPNKLEKLINQGGN